MNQDLLKFFEDISKDEEKLRKLFSYENPDDMYDYAKSESSEADFTKEEFEKCLKSILNLSESIESGKISKEELESGRIDEETLSEISGGGEETWGRNIAMLAPAVITLIIAGVGWYREDKKAKEEAKKRNDPNNIAYQDIVKKDEILQRKRRIKENEKYLSEHQ